LRSALQPERLAIELQSRVGPFLSQRGYRMVGHGLGGLAWRRDLSGRALAGVVTLGVLALGGVASGDLGTTVFGLACGVGAGVLSYHRRPANVTIGLTKVQGGTELTIAGGADAEKVGSVVSTVAGPPPAPRGGRP